MYPPHSNTSQYGGLSVGIPGELRGLAEMHRRWGRLEWRKLVEPAAHLAMGWKVGPELDKKLHVRCSLLADLVGMLSESLHLMGTELGSPL